ncbi:class I SAM-dependent methyltransferase [Rhodocytophaga aerolata]|uniref:Class I SAM-dependent methyltransferase n=1 Tax=Rhodocytophaga aerolata TaxID=455078 RepID=A0ABT8QZH1_9BACT|nr:class I SAM-dependent methyltransferase [Rhodocytophaga aerolata]MDO1444806.1 class I SAM-dependent methyltransferase [Rhodocytophaga aerolata]
MRYEPVKKRLGGFFGKSSLLRKVFYKLLDLLLLRAWHIHKELKAWAKDKLDKHIHILDAGAGFGQHTYFLANMSPKWSVLAVDVKQDDVCECNHFFHRTEKNNVLFRTEDLTKFQQPDTFDLILSVDVMEYIKEDCKVLKNFYHSLKEDGLLLLTVPSDKGGSDVYKPGDKSFIEEHIRNGYSTAEMKQKLKKAGFSKVDIKYTYGTPGNRSWRLSLKYPMLMVGTSKYMFTMLPFYYLLIFPVCYLLNYLDVTHEHKTGTSILVKAYK